MKGKKNPKSARKQTHSEGWLESVENAVASFASKHRLLFSTTERQLAAAFEIGCLHAVLNYYLDQSYSLAVKNLTQTNEYRYLTSPSGNPANFSYVLASGKDGAFEIRQQVRIESHINEDIHFTPDIVVIRAQAAIEATKKPEFAGGKRSFYSVSSEFVVAAHECKSMNPFPELLVSFLGMFVSAHKWVDDQEPIVVPTTGEGHLAPSLFVGGTARALHLKMIKAMQKSYVLNIICGLHAGTWGLRDATNRLSWMEKSLS